MASSATSPSIKNSVLEKLATGKKDGVQITSLVVGISTLEKISRRSAKSSKYSVSLVSDSPASKAQARVGVTVTIATRLESVKRTTVFS